MTQDKTLFDKLWASHAIRDTGDGATLIAIDRTCIHERTGAVALKSLSESGHGVFDPNRVFAIMDHIVSFQEGRKRDDSRSPEGSVFITETRRLAREAGIHLIDTNDPHQGIVHVIAPELGIAIPGVSIICPDSHTCSLGALGALAWGVGSSEAEHAIATGCLRVTKPPQMRIRIDGALREGVYAKDLALHLIARFGAAGGLRCAIEYAGTAIQNMSMEERLTLCNLAVEFSAFTALIAPDQTTIEYIHGRPYAPPHANMSDVLEAWKDLQSDRHSRFDHEIIIDASDVAPMISWGTSPEQSVALDGQIPMNADLDALEYVDFKPGDVIAGTPIEGAFIGSCTNGRLSDLREAGKVIAGRRVAEGVRAVCVPGSQSVKKQAEAEGLDLVFKDAGFAWGAPGCAMCFYAGGETFAPGARVISSTNRNFKGRQGPGVRTHLASPATVAASAIVGKIAEAGSLKLREDV